MNNNCCCNSNRCCIPNCCYPVVGPAGRDGQNATITIGTTTTTDPNTQASVTNSGTTTNAVLNFSIPRGAQGEAATISIGQTTTLPPGSNASVTNVGTNNNAILNFAIPGTNRIDSGSFISRIEQTFTTSNSIILLPTTLNSSNITNSNSVISISKTGRYKIDYGIRTTTSNNLIGIYINGNNNSNTNILTDENNNFISSSIILSLNANDVITLGTVNASQQIPLTLSSNTINAYLTIISLD